ncbi:unnamed protein product, partial [Brassica rapa]
LCVLNRQPTRAKITRTVHKKGQRAESKDQRADMCNDGQPRTSSTNVLCVLTNTHERPVCADGHPRTSRTSCVCWRTPTDVLCVLNKQPTWDKIPQTVHGKGQRAESKDQHVDMCTEGQPRTSCVAKITRTVNRKGQRAESKDQPTDVLCVLTDTHGHTRTATDVLCVLANTHGRPPQTAPDVLQPTWPISPKQSTGRVSMLTPRTNVLICVLMDRHGRPVCAYGNTQTHTTAIDIPCVLTDTHGRPVCADGTPTKVLVC